MYNKYVFIVFSRLKISLGLSTFVWRMSPFKKFMLEPYAMKVARTVLKGGKSEKIYLS